MNEDFSNVLLFSGSSHLELAKEIAKNLSLPLGNRKLAQFPDGETSVQILENVRGRDTFVIQTVALDPNEYLMEMLILIDALKRASARSIVAVLPYYGYCRQDRKDGPRVPITAKLVANMLEAAGATRVVTMDLHAGQLQGFFDIPVDHLHAWPLMVEALTGVDTKQLTVVSPDIGSVKIGHAYARALGVDLAIVDKTRLSPNKVEVATLIGDVKGKDVLLADDMCSTGGTLVSAAYASQKKGARKIVAAVTHGLFVGDALKKIEESPIELVYVSNTIPLSKEALSSKKIVPVSVSSLFSCAISCIISKESISSLFSR